MFFRMQMNTWQEILGLLGPEDCAWVCNTISVEVANKQHTQVIVEIDQDEQLKFFGMLSPKARMLMSVYTVYVEMADEGDDDPDPDDGEPLPKEVGVMSDTEIEEQLAKVIQFRMAI